MKTLLILNSKKIRPFLSFVILSSIVLPFQNCAEQDFTVVQSSVNTILVYDGSESDQELLRQKLDGAEPPTISQIFNQWSRVSGSSLYQKQTDIVPSARAAHCFTGLDDNGDWNKANIRIGNPNVSVQPGFENPCADDDSFGAASWSFSSSLNTLKVAVNANNHTGFISGVPVDRYENEAVVSSLSSDDDGIGLVVAALRDEAGKTHLLIAQRTHGGTAPSLGWGFLYAQYYSEGGVTKNIKKTVINASFDGKSQNIQGQSQNIAGQNGWSGKRTIIKVERNKDIIKAYTSLWSENASELLIPDLSSEISVDLSDPKNGLEIFRGAKKYGYSSISQYGSTFNNVKFKSTLDADKIYDLKNKLVYKLMDDNSGRYELAKGLTPKKDLGVNTYLVNPETQKTFFVWYNGNYEEVSGSLPDEVMSSLATK